MKSSKTFKPSLLDTLSPPLASALATANYRLRQPLSPDDVVSGLVLAHRSETALMLQPGHSGYAWSTRKVPLVFIAPRGDLVVVRVRQGFSYRNEGCTPNCWPELRGFPAGDVAEKLQRWAAQDDAIRIPRLALDPIERGKPEADCRQWSVPAF